MLASGNIKNNKAFSYKYDPNNLRYSKTVNGVETLYYWDDGVLLGERTGDNFIQYIYDANGIAGMRCNDTYYYFEKNLFGDVLRVYSVYGSVVAEFKYDSYGNIISSSGSMADKVKFRYRGYYYDDETGFYYLQSRYYDPSLCRFISADQYELVGMLSQTLGQLNLYAYCNNNPIMYTDESGEGLFSALLLGAIVGSIVGAVSYTAAEVISYVITGEWSWSWGMFVGSVLGGALGGMFGTHFGLISTAIFTGVTSTGFGMAFQNVIGEADNSFAEIFKMSILSGFISAVSAGIIKGIPIQGFNAGRGSLQQVAKQINTKLLRNQISNYTAKTFGKILVYNLGYSSLGSVISGFVDAYQVYNAKYNKSHRIVPVISV